MLSFFKPKASSEKVDNEDNEEAELECSPEKPEKRAPDASVSLQRY